MDPFQIGKWAWGYAGVLRDAGFSYFEYVAQLTLLLFLKMVDQLMRGPTTAPLDGAALEDRYRASLEKLGIKPGMLGVIFKGACREIRNSALLKQFIVNLRGALARLYGKSRIDQRCWRRRAHRFGESCASCAHFGVHACALPRRTA